MNEKYVITNDQWQQTDVDVYEYVDEELDMFIRLERDYDYYDPYDTRPQEPYYTLTAQSGTIADENNCYFYDALEPSYYCGPRMTRREASYFFDNNDIMDIELPAWLIEQMQWLVEYDAFNDENAWAWTQENKETEWRDCDAMEESAINWYRKHYPDGSEYCNFEDEIVYYAEMHGYVWSYNGPFKVCV